MSFSWSFASRSGAVASRAPARALPPPGAGLRALSSLARLLAVALVLLPVALLSVAPAFAQTGAPAGEWPHYSGDLGSTKYSPLASIDRGNVGSLRVAWRWVSPDGAYLDEAVKAKVPGARISNLKATPLAIDGRLYILTPLGQAAALDAATGETIWLHNPRTAETGLPAMSLNFNQRGLAYWREPDGSAARVLFGTNDGYLLALDAATGEPIPSFGENGRVDLSAGLAFARRDERDHKGRHYYSSASPPVVCREVVVVPCSISDDPFFREMPEGHVRGYDVRTGKRLWEFRTIPPDGAPGAETWEGDSNERTGGANVWAPFSADESLGVFYLPTGTPTSDWYGGHRPGDNLFAECVLALDARTGARVWHYQIVRHGLWDYDPPCAPNLMDLRIGDRVVKAVAQVTKHGFVFVFDRETGEPIWLVEDREVPTSDVPGEQTAPRQPFPTKPPPFERQGIAEDDLIDFTPELKAEALKIVSEYRIGPLFTPPSLPRDGRKGTIVNPGWGGGANWTGAAFDPETGYLYVPSTTAPIVPVLTEPDAPEANIRYVRQSIQGVRGPQGLPLVKPPWSRITAYDMNAGEIVWQVPHGDASAKTKAHPALAGLDLPKLGGGGKSGPLVTKTLLFVAASGEAGEDAAPPALVAYDKATGDVVAEVALPDRARGAPTTYLANRKQYIALTINGSPPELIALALP